MKKRFYFVDHFTLFFSVRDPVRAENAASTSRNRIFLHFFGNTVGRKTDRLQNKEKGRDMLGFLMSAVAGAAMSIQGVMNTRLGEKIGLYESNAFVQGTAFLLSVIAVLVLGKGNFRSILEVDKLYLFGGVLGIVITVTVMLGIGKLSPTVAISTILISQLLVAALIDAFGWMGSEQVPFGWTKYVGLGLMIAGVILFKK